MARKPEPKQDDPAQAKRFVDTAREVEADETEEGAERVFKKIAPSKLKTDPRRD